MSFSLPSVVVLPPGPPVAHLVELAAVAEQLGFTAVWVPDDATARSALVSLTGIGLRTRTLGLGFGASTPLLLSERILTSVVNGVATLFEMTDGRAMFGVGFHRAFTDEPEPTGDGAIEFHTAEDELLAVVGALRTGDVVDHHGEFVELAAAQVAHADPGLRTWRWVEDHGPENSGGADERVVTLSSVRRGDPSGCWVEAPFVTSEADRRAGANPKEAFIGTPAECADALRDLAERGVAGHVLTIHSLRFAVDVLESAAEVLSLV